MGIGAVGTDGSRLAGWGALDWTNNGGLALAFFLRQVASLLVVGLFYLDANEFCASSPSCGI
jgi:hypothetical protein